MAATNNKPPAFEAELFHPSEAVISRAHIKDYESQYKYSIEKREEFWAEQAKQSIKGGKGWTDTYARFAGMCTIRNKAIRIMVWQLVPNGKTCLMTGSALCAVQARMPSKRSNRNLNSGAKFR